MSLNEIINNFKENNTSYNYIKMVFRDNSLLYSELLENTKFLDEYYDNIPISQRLYHIWHDDFNIKLCNICNNPIKFRHFRKNDTYYCYFKTCDDIICRNKHRGDSIKNIMIEKYGNDNPFKIIEFQEKIKNTNFQKYGSEYHSQSDNFHKKTKETMYKKYGVENPFQVQEFKEKSKKTMVEKYGVEYSMQNNVLLKKQQMSGYKRKLYILPSGKEVKIQGYEPRFLDEYFLNGGLESNILINDNDIEKYLNKIWYNTSDGKKHRYYPDFYLIGENKIIEVKSMYTLNKYFTINELKKQSCLDKGLNFEYKIYDDK